MNPEPEVGVLGEVESVEDLLDRESLMRLCRSFFNLFGLSIRLVAHNGTLLADAHEEQSVCRYVNSLTPGAVACSAVVSSVKASEGDTTMMHPCFTGAVYKVVPIVYQGRPLARAIVGPYLPAETREVPDTLLSLTQSIDPDQARNHLSRMPRVNQVTSEKIESHLREIIDNMIFTSHQSHITSEMHVRSVRENYRELALKNYELKEAYDQLRELDKLKSNFLATMSHELRTPLTSILGYSEMLTSGLAGDLSTDQRGFIDTIHEKGEHLLRLITNLLDVGRLEQGTLRLRPQSIDPNELLAEVASTAAPSARKKGIELVIECDDLPAEAPELDRLRMTQILTNLVDNAIKFTPEGGQVTLGAEAAELGADPSAGEMGLVLMEAAQPAVTFSVRDNGVGMKEDQLDRIFDAFYQVDSSSTRSHDGAGLGLSIVKRLTEAHGGHVEVESVHKEGTVFRVTVPLSQTDED